jgi:hypothetical protein
LTIPVGAYCHTHLHFRTPSQTIGAIVRGFKSAATKRINEIRKTPGARLWQRNYYEHVIRNDDELSRVREYIVNNPGEWNLDRENPDGKQNPRSGVRQRAAIDEIESICDGIRP